MQTIDFIVLNNALEKKTSIYTINQSQVVLLLYNMLFDVQYSISNEYSLTTLGKLHKIDE